MMVRGLGELPGELPGEWLGERLGEWLGKWLGEWLGGGDLGGLGRSDMPIVDRNPHLVEKR
ncbi:hypothetical protein [Halomonas litopenaei]|uniref:hypothetical protein n=1 Tax=Halomonas litopenaei TaxID=2109328 RepID=UPI001A8EC2DE|nr:hypothetical protein [Halomonas litopenaei]MBN8411486.1 hypothetical protein [Halomonas litopenaei]